MAEERALAPYEAHIYDVKVKKTFLEVTNEKTYLKEVIFAKQAFDASDSLQKCAPASIRNAIVNVALTGATLNPALQQAFLIPRKGKACLDFSYRGLTQIAVSSGGVLDIDADVVYDKDEFIYERGLSPVLTHRPFMGGDRGKKKYVYATAVLPSGIKKFIVLDAFEIDKVKKTSQAKSGPWVDWEDEMWRKTAVKKLYKLLPQTERMSTAVAVLNAHEGIEKPSKAAELEKRFDYNQEKTVEGEIEPEKKLCPTSNQWENCDECKEKSTCPEHK